MTTETTDKWDWQYFAQPRNHQEEADLAVDGWSYCGSEFVPVPGGAHCDVWRRYCYRRPRTGLVEPRPRDPVGSSLKDTNPKQAFADGKVPLDAFPDTAAMLGALALMDGALKYGRWNWRASGVRAAIYVAACRRHLMAWYNGEEDAEDGVPHLGHALACLAILVDARACGRLRDDRPPRMDVAEWTRQLTAWVPRIKERHAGKTPRHWTIEDELPGKDA